MTEKYIIAHDMGTSSNKAVLFTIHGEIVQTAQKSYPVHHPSLGFAEQDPSDWWDAVCETTRTVLEESGIATEEVAGITFCSQMQTFVPVDREGTPLMRAILWLDTRAADIMREKLWTPPRVLGYNIFHLLRFLRITGGSPGHTGKDPIGKVLWLKEYKPEIFLNTYKFLDMKDFIIHRLTGKMVKSVDLGVVWWLMDTRRNRNCWHPKLCSIAGIEESKLPEIRESGTITGNLNRDSAEQMGLIPSIPVIVGAGDITAAAIGSGAIDEGELHIRIGTSGGVAGHFKKRKIDVPNYAGCIGSAHPQKYYLAIGAQETTGASLDWLKNNVLCKGDPREDDEIYSELNDLARNTEPGSEGLVFTPWLFGERCPLDDDTVRAGFFNMGLNHSRRHFIRAVMEGVACNIRWAMGVLENLYSPVSELNMVGGGARSDVWCQIMADVTNRTIHQVTDPHKAAAKGVALLASMTLGYIDRWKDIKNHVKINQTFYPDQDNRELYDTLFREFKLIYKQNKKWYARMNASKQD